MKKHGNRASSHVTPSCCKKRNQYQIKVSVLVSVIDVGASREFLLQLVNVLSIVINVHMME